MPSIIPGFQYDVFISYRHNDNRSGWVTEFVKNLQEELAATIKEPVSVYFDVNPHDGLLETHNVDKSLETKLRSVIFIPILSQTYCDTKSFAWQHEFCAFNRMSKEESFGRDITLGSGNVSSRILPVRVHDLDPADKAMLEKEIGGNLRAIDFIYKEPGVNRALRPGDSKQDNLNKTDYKNQVNKVANAIKETISAIQSPTQAVVQPQESKPGPARGSVRRPAVIAGVLTAVAFVIAALILVPRFQAEVSAEAARSIAVLSFVDMSPNKDQEYLGDGIAEEILNALTRVEGLRVIGRTSSFSFKGKDVNLKTIGDALGASVVLEGSIQKSGDKLRITAQLINVEDETHIWSERYESNEADIFAIQDDIVGRIVQKMKSSLMADDIADETQVVTSKAPTSNLQAYEMFLRARHLRLMGMHMLDQSAEFYRKAIELDPSFSMARVDLAYVYWTKALTLVRVSEQKALLAKSREEVEKAIDLDPTSYQAHNYLAFISLTADWDTVAYLRNFNKAVSLGLPLPDVWHGQYEQFFKLRHDKVVNEAEQMLEKDPLSIDAMVHLSRCFLYARRFEDVIALSKKALEQSPDQSSILRHVSEAYMLTGRPEMALPLVTRLMEKSPLYTPQNYVAVNVMLGKKDVAVAKFTELKDAMPSYKRAICFIYLNNIDSAFVALEQACREPDLNLFGIQSDHQMDAIRSDPRFAEIVRCANTPLTR